MSGVGDYGCKTPYLVNEYGMTSELCQAFARYSAVWGGVFMMGVEFTISRVGQVIKVCVKDVGEFTCENLVTSCRFQHLVGDERKGESMTEWISMQDCEEGEAKLQIDAGCNTLYLCGKQWIWSTEQRDGAEEYTRVVSIYFTP